MADELSGADDGEADGGEGGHGAHQGEEDSAGRQFNRIVPVFGSIFGTISGPLFRQKFWIPFNGLKYTARQSLATLRAFVLKVQISEVYSTEKVDQNQFLTD